MKTLFIIGIFLFCAPSWGCRIVCSQGNTLWHMLADGDTGKFQVLKDSEVVTRGLTCHLLPANGNELEKEEQRLVNLCFKQEPKGKRITFRSDRIQQRQIKLGLNGPEEEIVEKLVWTWKDGEKTTLQVELDRNECGSSSER